MGFHSARTEHSLGGFPDYGAIFMSNRRTKQECLEKNIFGLPAKFADFVTKVKAGMVLFLFEFENRRLFGVFRAISDGAMNIIPDAYISSGKQFSAQVQVSKIWECHPLHECDFRDAIEENYYTHCKFNFGLSKNQVQKLLELYSRAILVPKSDRLFRKSVAYKVDSMVPEQLAGEKDEPLVENQPISSDVPHSSALCRTDSGANNSTTLRCESDTQSIGLLDALPPKTQSDLSCLEPTIVSNSFHDVSTDLGDYIPLCSSSPEHSPEHISSDVLHSSALCRTDYGANNSIYLKRESDTQSMGLLDLLPPKGQSDLSCLEPIIVSNSFPDVSTDLGDYIPLCSSSPEHPDSAEASNAKVNQDYMYPEVSDSSLVSCNAGKKQDYVSLSFPEHYDDSSGAGYTENINGESDSIEGDCQVKESANHAVSGRMDHTKDADPVHHNNNLCRKALYSEKPGNRPSVFSRLNLALASTEHESISSGMTALSVYDIMNDLQNRHSKWNKAIKLAENSIPKVGYNSRCKRKNVFARLSSASNAVSMRKEGKKVGGRKKLQQRLLDCRVPDPRKALNMNQVKMNRNFNPEIIWDLENRWNKERGVEQSALLNFAPCNSEGNNSTDVVMSGNLKRRKLVRPVVVRTESSDDNENELSREGLPPSTLRPVINCQGEMGETSKSFIKELKLPPEEMSVHEEDNEGSEVRIKRGIQEDDENEDETAERRNKYTEKLQLGELGGARSFCRANTLTEQMIANQHDNFAFFNIKVVNKNITASEGISPFCDASTVTCQDIEEGEILEEYS